MNRIIVIADDITGAAEIAGIAHRYGLRTILSLTSSPPEGNEGGFESTEDADVIVIATDARSYNAEEAASITRKAFKCLTIPPSDFLFHKVDSAMRGNVQAQLDALGGEWLYMPANPSKGRIIKDGIYYITTVPSVSPEGKKAVLTPLHETDFSFDPEFPAWSSSVEERFPGIRYANAENTDEVDEAVEMAMNQGLMLAGAADLFESLLRKCYPDHSPQTPEKTFSLTAGATDESYLLVCGSTQSKAMDLDMPVFSMPMDVFYEKAEPVTWSASILSHPSLSSLILTIGDKEVRPGKAAAVYLRTAMAEVACTLVEALHPNHLVIEGGATAFAILSALPYSSFDIVSEIAPGVVQIAPSGVSASDALTVVLKPGSYSWGKFIVS